MRTARLAAVVAALLLTAPASVARADPEASRQAALSGDAVAFCSTPKLPLSAESLELCHLAKEIPACEGLAKACDEALAPKPKRSAGAGWLDTLAPLGYALGRALLWIFVAGVAAALLVPIVRGILAWARSRRARDFPEARARQARVRTAPAALAPALRREAREILGRAETAESTGALGEAIALYLAAALRALDERGHIALARHRTNGEYVRACQDAALRRPLAEMTLAADAIEFGGRAPDPDRARAVGDRARALLRALSFLTVLAALPGLACAGRGGTKRAVDDPAGLEVFREIARGEGYAVQGLGGSIATLPIPKEGEKTFLLVLDASRVQLSDDASSRLLRWVGAGGSLLLLGEPARWPKALGAKPRATGSRDVTVQVDDGEVFHDVTVRVSQPGALTWPGAEAIAVAGGEPFAARVALDRGVIVGLARPDPFTNVGLSQEGAGDVAMALVEQARPVDGTEIRVARPEDGVTPPGNPLSALSRAGLSVGLVHAVPFLALLFLHAGIRHARARPAPEPTRRAFVEHVRATGAFYMKARAHEHAVHEYAKHAREVLRARAPRDATLAQYVAWRANVPEREVTRLLEPRTPGITRKGAAAHIRAVRDLLDRAAEPKERTRA